MIAYLERRIALSVPVLFGITLIVFLVLRLSPGDPALALAGMEADAATLNAMRAEYGLDRPMGEQYIVYMQHLLAFDLGRSTVTRRPVAQTLAERFPTTAVLALSAITLAVLVGVTMGVIAARFHQRWPDYLMSLLAMGLLSIPNYVLGLLLIILFAAKLQVLPAVGGSTPAHYILPVITVGSFGIAALQRQTRSAVLEVMNEDYVRTARGKGVPEGRVLSSHVLRNALIPILTTIGLVFGSLVSGAVIIETVFSFSGIGDLLVSSIAYRDYPMVQGGVLLIAVSYVVVNILVDIAYVIIDPRVRLS